MVQQTLDKISYDRILDIYKERFSDAANFKTVIIGNFDEQQLRQYLCLYLASLPATGKHEHTNQANVPQIVDGQQLVNAVTAADVQRMAQKILAAKRCIEVTMLSE